MWREIERLGRDEGITVLLTTHYLEEADRLAAQLAIVDRGKVVATGSPDELKRELSGDAVQVELEQRSERGAPGARGSCRHPRGLGRRSPSAPGGADGARAVPAVLAALETHGVGVASVTVARPSLDDVYLRCAGRSFGAADEKEVSR